MWRWIILLFGIFLCYNLEGFHFSFALHVTHRYSVSENSRHMCIYAPMEGYIYSCVVFGVFTLGLYWVRLYQAEEYCEGAIAVCSLTAVYTQLGLVLLTLRYALLLNKRWIKLCMKMKILHIFGSDCEIRTSLLLFQVCVLTIILPRFPDAIILSTLSCLCELLPHRSVQTTMLNALEV